MNYLKYMISQSSPKAARRAAPLAVLAVLAGVFCLAPSWAQGPEGENPPGNSNADYRDGRGMRDRGREHLILGICVGETLAQQGVTYPTDGTPPDSTTQTAVKAAIQTCQAELRGGPSPSPSAVPTEIPTPLPTAPVSTGTPAPSSSGS